MLYNVKISGMGCMHCVARVKAALEALGAKDAKVEINSAEFSFDGGADAVADPDGLVSRWYVRADGSLPFERAGEGAYITEAMDKKTLLNKLGKAGHKAAFRILE